MTSQMDIVIAIWEALDKAGVKTMNDRISNKVIELANECVALPQMAEDGMRLEAWLQSDDTGMSSRWMAHVCAGSPVVKPYDEGSYPHDPADFGRCYRFLQAVPSARLRLSELKNSGAVWSAYVDRWDEMEALWLEESPSGKAPKLFKLMWDIQDEARKAVKP